MRAIRFYYSLCTFYDTPQFEWFMMMTENWALAVFANNHMSCFRLIIACKFDEMSDFNINKDNWFRKEILF